MAGDDPLAPLADRSGWAVAGRLAIFEPELGRWRAVARPIRLPGRTFARIHIAIVDPAGRAHLALVAVTVNEARRVAEAHEEAMKG